MTKAKHKKIQFWSGVAFLLAVIGGLIVGGIKIQDYLQDAQRAPVQVVEDLKMRNS